jgi:hypothetical protein
MLPLFKRPPFRHLEDHFTLITWLFRTDPRVAGTRIVRLQRCRFCVYSGYHHLTRLNRHSVVAQLWPLRFAFITACFLALATLFLRIGSHPQFRMTRKTSAADKQVDVITPPFPGKSAFRPIKTDHCKPSAKPWSIWGRFRQILALEWWLLNSSHG